MRRTKASAPTRGRRRRPTPSVATGALWSSANVLVMKLATIAVTVFVVRIVSPHDFGTFTAALVVYTVVGAFSDLGVSVCIARRDIDYEDVAPVIVSISLVSSAVFAGCTFLFAGPVAAGLGAPEATNAIQVLSGSILLGGLTAVPTALLTRNYRQGSLFTANALAFLPANALLVLLALDGDGAMAFAWSRLVGQAIAAAAIFVTARRWFWPGWNSGAAWRALGLGMPLAGANLLNYGLLNADYVFIGAFLGPALLGVYTLAFNVASWSTSVLGAAVNGVAMPAFSEAKSDPDILRRNLERWLTITGLVAFPVAALSSVLAQDIVHVLYGPTWAEAGPVLSVLALYGGFFIVTLLASNLLVGAGRTAWVFSIQAVWLVTLLASVAAGVSALGIIGAAWAHLGVIALVVGPMYAYAVRGIVPRLGHLLIHTLRGSFIGAVVAAAAAYAVGEAASPGLARLVLGGLVGAAAFVFFAWPELLKRVPLNLAARLSHVTSLRSHVVKIFHVSKGGQL